MCMKYRYSGVCNVAEWLTRNRDMTHSHVWHDSFIHVTLLIHMCDVEGQALRWLLQCTWMTHSYMWHDSFIYVTWLIHMRHAEEQALRWRLQCSRLREYVLSAARMSHVTGGHAHGAHLNISYHTYEFIVPHVRTSHFIGAHAHGYGGATTPRWRLRCGRIARGCKGYGRTPLHVWLYPIICVWYDAFICLMLCQVTRMHVCHTLLIHMSDIAHSYSRYSAALTFAMWMSCARLNSVWHDSWLTHVCDRTHSCVWHDSFICALQFCVGVCEVAGLRAVEQGMPWLMAHSYVWYDSFICGHDSCTPAL